MDAVPPRDGPRPSTTSVIPHRQLDQQPTDARLLDELLAEAATWSGVRTGPSGISVEGARALSLTEGVPPGPPEAFMVGREFCHGHAQGDHSLHLTLPLDLVDRVEAAGWTEPHFLVHSGRLPRTHVMLYAPRDEAEAAVGLSIVRLSYAFATGGIS